VHIMRACMLTGGPGAAQLVNIAEAFATKLQETQAERRDCDGIVFQQSLISYVLARSGPWNVCCDICFRRVYVLLKLDWFCISVQIFIAGSSAAPRQVKQLEDLSMFVIFTLASHESRTAGSQLSSTRSLTFAGACSPFTTISSLGTSTPTRTMLPASWREA
jgi:hypothetical protein